MPAATAQTGFSVSGSNFALSPAPAANGAIASATITASGDFHTQGFQPSFDWISVSLVWTGAAPGPPVPGGGTYTYCGKPPSGPPAAPCQGTDITFSVPMNLTNASNGPYKVNATAQASDIPNRTQTQSMPAPINFNLVVPPPPVTNVKAVVNKDRSVSVSWDRNTVTPDMQGYYIYRQSPGQKDFTAMGQTAQPTSGTRITLAPDTTPQSAGGNYTYAVEARRNGATGDNKSVSPSDKSKSVATVAVPNPPPGTVTTVPPPPAPSGNVAPPPVLKSTTSGVSSNISSSPATTPTSEAVTPDPGFARGLPYSSSNTQPGAEGEGGGDPTVALTPSGGRHRSSSSGALKSVAAGAVLFVGAFHLRWLKKQLDVPASTLS